MAENENETENEIKTQDETQTENENENENHIFNKTLNYFYMLLHIIDIVLFILFTINVVYLAFFSIASLFHKNILSTISAPKKKFAILIPAYKEDAVIMECVESCLSQSYESDKYDIVVISDRMSDQTNNTLGDMKLKLIKVNFENSTKSKALNYAMSQLNAAYDIAIILDADNTISHDFLSNVNDAMVGEVEIIQTHRCAKNINTHLALLDAVSEEVNNSIFRQGHTQVGLSAALIGSGMCFNYNLFKDTMLTIDAVGGFDRALELTLIRSGKKIYYMPDVDVLDEKVQQQNDFTRQRRRWLSAQCHYFTKSLKFVPQAIKNLNVDYLDKVFQQMSMPRVMLIGFCTIIAIVITLINPTLSIKWWVILVLLITVLIIATPRKMFTVGIFKAVIHLPYYFLLMVANLFKLRGANKQFIHTSHGVKR